MVFFVGGGGEEGSQAHSSESTGRVAVFGTVYRDLGVVIRAFKGRSR